MFALAVTFHGFYDFMTFLFMRSDAIDCLINANQTYFIIEIVCFNAHTFFNLN